MIAISVERPSLLLVRTWFVLVELRKRFRFISKFDFVKRGIIQTWNSRIDFVASSEMTFSSTTSISLSWRRGENERLDASCFNGNLDNGRALLSEWYYKKQKVTHPQYSSHSLWVSKNPEGITWSEFLSITMATVWSFERQNRVTQSLRFPTASAWREKEKTICDDFTVIDERSFLQEASWGGHHPMRLEKLALDHRYVVSRNIDELRALIEVHSLICKIFYRRKSSFSVIRRPGGWAG